MLNSLHAFSFITNVGAILIPILQIRKLKHEGQNQHVDTGFSGSKGYALEFSSGLIMILDNNQ